MTESLTITCLDRDLNVHPELVAKLPYFRAMSKFARPTYALPFKSKYLKEYLERGQFMRGEEWKYVTLRRFLGVKISYPAVIEPLIAMLKSKSLHCLEYIENFLEQASEDTLRRFCLYYERAARADQVSLEMVECIGTTVRRMDSTSFENGMLLLSLILPGEELKVRMRKQVKA